VKVRSNFKKIRNPLITFNYLDKSDTEWKRCRNKSCENLVPNLCYLQSHSCMNCVCICRSCSYRTTTTNYIINSKTTTTATENYTEATEQASESSLITSTSDLITSLNSTTTIINPEANQQASESSLTSSTSDLITTSSIANANIKDVVVESDTAVLPPSICCRHGCLGETLYMLKNCLNSDIIFFILI